MTDLSRRGFIASIAAVAAASAMPALPDAALAGPAAALPKAALAGPMERLRQMLAMPLEGEASSGLMFMIGDDEIVEHFGGHRANIDWPEGNYGVFSDNKTGQLFVYRVSESQQDSEFWGFWGEEPMIQYRRPSHWAPEEANTPEPEPLRNRDALERAMKEGRVLASWEIS